MNRAKFHVYTFVGSLPVVPRRSRYVGQRLGLELLDEHSPLKHFMHRFDAVIGGVDHRRRGGVLRLVARQGLPAVQGRGRDAKPTRPRPTELERGGAPSSSASESASARTGATSAWLRSARCPRTDGVHRRRRSPRATSSASARATRRVARRTRRAGRGEDPAAQGALLDVERPRRARRAHAGRRAGRLPARPRPARASTRSRAACSRRCTAAASGRCACSPASARPSRRTSASSTCSRRARPGLSTAFDFPTLMGYDCD